MTQFRRDVLAGIAQSPGDTHAGLWLDKYLQGDGEDAKKNLVKDVTGIKTPDSYRRFFDRWKETLVEICGAANCREAKTLGRLAINLGAEGVLETSVALQHTYGVPYIPGSALKGLAAHYVMHYLKEEPRWDKKADGFLTLFGDTTSAGYVTFYDALFVPGSGKLVPDVITVHHPDYYQGGDKPPADWDSPTPIPFITATGRFLVALSSDYPEWVKAGFEILELALEREGVGAKTSSGYGRMTFKTTEEGRGSGVAAKQKSAPREVLAGYERGVVKNFMEANGYGFIQPASGKDIFVHVNDLEPGLDKLKAGQSVIFKRGPGRKPGQLQAFDVRVDE